MASRIGISWLISVSLLLGGNGVSANAQDEARQFSAKSGEVVNEIIELASESQMQAALNRLEELLITPGLVPYERSTIYQMMGQYSYELNQPIEAQWAFENAIKAGGLLPEEIDKIKITIVQLMVVNGRYRDGAERMEAYLSGGGEQKPQHVDLLVQAWLQADDYPRALPWAEKWFEMASPRQRKHYDLLNFLYNNLGMRDEQIETIKTMVERWPDDKTLWDSLVSVLASSGQEKEAFEVTRLMYQAGLLQTEKEIRTLVQYHDYYDLPFQGAEILEAEIGKGRVSKTADNLKILASLFRQARGPDRALPIMEEVANLSDNLEAHAELAEALSHMGECDKAKTTFQTAIQQGYLQNKARMRIGSCYADRVTNAKRLSCNMTDSQVATAPVTLARKAALETFEDVPKTSEYYADARKWVSFIKADLQTYERRCGHNWHDYERELCFQHIKQAYDAVIFADGFKLDDKSCEKYVPEYDAKFRNINAED